MDSRVKYDHNRDSCSTGLHFSTQVDDDQKSLVSVSIFPARVKRGELQNGSKQQLDSSAPPQLEIRSRLLSSFRLPSR